MVVLRLDQMFLPNKGMGYKKGMIKSDIPEGAAKELSEVGVLRMPFTVVIKQVFEEKGPS